MLLVNAILWCLIIVTLLLTWATVRLLRQSRYWVAVILVIIAFPISTLLINNVRAIPPFDMLFAQGPHRQLKKCENTKSLIAWRNVEIDGDEGKATPRLECPVQLTHNPEATSEWEKDDTGISAKKCWSAGERPANCYTLAFLQLGHNGEPQEDIALVLQTHLKGVRGVLDGVQLDGKPEEYAEEYNAPSLYVIAYVHGWRHNAEIGDSNIRALRIIAANAKNNLAERCRIVRKHCRTAVLALYVSWPGQVALDDSKRKLFGTDKKWGDLYTAPNFPSRKALTDRIGTVALNEIETVARTAKAVFGGSKQNKFLLLGHSLGGNMLLSGIAARTRNQRPINLEENLAADLTVLLNPASEHRKWEDVFARVSISSKFGLPPRLMAISASCSYGTDPEHCDEIVGDTFARSQRILTFPRNHRFKALPKEDRGFGHTDPEEGQWHFLEYNEDKHASWCKDEEGENIKGCIKGKILKKVWAKYYSANKQFNYCFYEKGFLNIARQVRTYNTWKKKYKGNFSGSSLSEPWNFGDPDGSLTIGLTSSFGKVNEFQTNVQFGTGFGPDPRRQIHAVPIRSIWAVRSHTTAVAKHNSVFPLPLHCMLNKMVLDEPGTADAVNDIDEAKDFLRSKHPDYQPEFWEHMRTITVDVDSPPKN